MKQFFAGACQFFKDMFSESSAASFSRGATAVTVLTACWSIVYLVRHNRALPDAITLGALATWMVAPYGVGKIAGIFISQPSPPTQ